MNQYHNPVKLVFGIGIFNSLTEILGNSGLVTKRILLLTGKNHLKTSGYLELILQALEEKVIFEYNHIPSNPEVEDLYHIKSITDNYDYDSIIAIGGGSVLDIGKCLAAFKDIVIKDSIVLQQYITTKSYEKQRIDIPIIAIPTTAGTGSEVTSWATVWDKRNNKKYSVEHGNIYPKIAIMDPQLTMSLPLELTVATALDALSHALEAYWSKKTNAIVRIYSLKAIENIFHNIVKVADNLDDIYLREKIAYGSLYAGLAFSNTRTTACHSISYPLTSMFNIPHGIATSLTLGQFLKINKESLVDTQSLLNAFGVSEIDDVEDQIKFIYNKARIPSRLREYGVDRDDFSNIIENSFTPGRMDNNPVEITGKKIWEVLENLY